MTDELGVCMVGLGKLGACMAARDRRPRPSRRGPRPQPARHRGGERGKPRAGGRTGPGGADQVESRAAVGDHELREGGSPFGRHFRRRTTPSDERGAFSAEHAKAAFAEIGRALRDSDRYHLVVLTSTVLPAVTRQVLQPILERESGQRYGQDLGLCYSPEFIALGSEIDDFLNPDFVLIGDHERRAGDALERCYGQIVRSGAPRERMSLENAELAKIALNAFVTTKIAFANTIAELGDRTPGGDVDAVTGAIGTDGRIGARYQRRGLGFGGPCFPRDNVTFAFLARTHGSRADTSEATDARNRRRLDDVLAVLQPLLNRGGRIVAVLGLAYKPGTAVVEGSQGLELARRLRQRGVPVLAFDPLADEIHRQLDSEIPFARSLEECVETADILANPDPTFGGLEALVGVRGHEASALIDCWRVVQGCGVVNSRRYYGLGRGRFEGEIASNFAGLWTEQQEAVAG